MTQYILEGFNQKKPAQRTIAISLDASKAFDKVSKFNLMKKIMEIENMNINDKRWLSNYITDRRAAVIFGNATSRWRHFKNGVPQGGVLSPQLFNFYVAKCCPPPPEIVLLSYADDFMILSRGNNIKEMEARMQNYLDSVVQWFDSLDILLSPSKSTVTIFTPDTHQYHYHPQIMIKGNILPLEKYPKVLGVRFDPLMKFTRHVDDINSKARTKLNVLKAVSSVDSGQSKEDLLYLYRQFIRPHFSYASNAWRPNISKTSMAKMQATQNMCLRAASGLTKLTSIDTLHRETKMLKVEEHLNMIGAQAAAKYESPAHPLHCFLEAPRPPRKMKETPAHYYNKFIPKDDMTIAQRVKLIHTNLVRDSLASLERSKLTNSVPPDINDEELGLPRNVRVDLARLRSGNHPRLEDYLHRIGTLKSPRCRRCHAATGTVEHFLLRCPTLSRLRLHHSITTVLILWTNPLKAANYILEAGL